MKNILIMGLLLTFCSCSGKGQFRIGPPTPKAASMHAVDGEAYEDSVQAILDQGKEKLLVSANL